MWWNQQWSNTSTSIYPFLLRLLFDLGIQGSCFTSMMNLEARPCFAGICTKCLSLGDFFLNLHWFPLLFACQNHLLRFLTSFSVEIKKKEVKNKQKQIKNTQKEVNRHLGATPKWWLTFKSWLTIRWNIKKQEKKIQQPTRSIEPVPWLKYTTQELISFWGSASI